MELKLGSIWLLLSCSLQQSLWGILASVPRTNAKKCTEQLSNDGERAAVKKVQMIRRIPARCSGWDEAWSWITKMDCRTKYVLDYIELPFDVKKSEHSDCETDTAKVEESKDFDFTDEKFLAIAFGSATVLLLILIVIIVVSLVKRGHTRCGTICRRPTDYTAANGSDNEGLGDQHICNEYVDEGLKLVEPEYEEIVDPNAKDKEKLLNVHPHEPSADTELKSLCYQNVPDPVQIANGANLMNGLCSKPIIPSAPYEEDIQQTAVKNVSSEHLPEISNDVSNENCASESISEKDTERLESAQVETKVKEIEEFEPVDKLKSKDIAENEKNEKSNEKHPKAENVYSHFDDIVISNQSETQKKCDAVSKTHSYENLDPDKMDGSVLPDYESLVQPAAKGDHVGKNCSDIELQQKEYDSNLTMQNLKDIDPSDSPIQCEDSC